MKKVLLLLLLVFTTASFAQTAEKEDIKYVKITQKKCLKRKGYTLILKQVLSDSRCPEGVNCIWAGEAKIIVSVYKNKKFVEDATITISPNQNEETKDWFSKYLPVKYKKIKSIGVLPYPKEGSKIDPKDYYVKIGYLR